LEQALHILVVDDEVTNREAISEALEGEGYRVTAVGSGEEALDAVRWLHPPRAAVVDLRMPQMDGRSLVEALRSDPSLRDLAIVAVTAGPPTGVEGADALLQKPFGVDALVQALSASRSRGTVPS
jgi:CheY-like chemotaxis protein